MKNSTIKNIGLGIICLGKMAGKFATDLAILSNTEIYAVASISQEKAANFTQKFNAKKSCSSYIDLVKDTHIDAVFIAASNSFHKAHAISCLENIKAVLCEKKFCNEFARSCGNNFSGKRK